MTWVTMPDSAGAFFQHQRDDADVLPQRPAEALPELDARRVVVEDKQVALVDARRPQRLKRRFRQPPPDAAFAIVRMNRKVMNVPPPPVMPSQYGADQLFPVPRTEAAAGVALKVFGYAAAGVRVGKPDALTGLPQGEGIGVRGWGEGAEDSLHNQDIDRCLKYG